MFKKFEKYVFYHGRKFNHPLSFGDKMFIIWNWMTMPFRKWKLVNVFENRIIPYNTIVFILTDKEKEAADNIRKEHGDIEYIMYPFAGLGWGVKVRVIKSGEEFDITDLDSI